MAGSFLTKSAAHFYPGPINPCSLSPPGPANTQRRPTHFEISGAGRPMFLGFAFVLSFRPGQCRKGRQMSKRGFGMTTPRTAPGKIVLIFYGFFGCAGAILFFNLFLERIITFLAFILRAIHERDLKRKGLINEVKDAGGRRSSQVSEDDQLDSWKPSVYWVMLILMLGAMVVAVCASSMYYPVEEWTYLEAIYFCFVTFATIGFGDYVVSQKNSYSHMHLYRLGNFLFIVLGCCCVYSLFNVTSIVIKQVLNWLLRRLNCDCSVRKPP
ncbi:hypothetical protein C0Q70_14265 [Pomacea canaliculata]|uniref:Potassium channel domain-containing protein n=1 Tax=Pomacea canaliculata TaxID=400727 RepID=A0A2T7NZJ4_POMCA|nr:hypothetical protein C0Q70_14265 [Pomacea canaliculata]